MKFLIDAQLPPALALWLRDRGHEADHVLALGLLGASDDQVWSFALATESIIVTKDRDFAEWAIKRRPCPQIVWLRVGNLPNGALFERLAPAWPKVMIGLNSGALVVEGR